MEWIKKTQRRPKGRHWKRCISSGLHTGSNGVQNDSNTASLMAVIFMLLLFVWSQLKSSKSSTEVWLSRHCCCVHVCSLDSFILLGLLNFTAKYHLASTTITNCRQWKYCIFIIFIIIKLNSNSGVSFRLTKYNEVWPHEKQPLCPGCLHRCPSSVGVGVLLQ